MSGIPERFQRAVDAARKWKEERVAENLDDLAPGGPAELPTTLDFVRDGRSIALVVCALDRDAMLQAIFLGVTSYGADELCVIHETFGSVDFEKAMGRRPDPGEFQELFAAGRTDLVYEQISIMRATRGSDEVEYIGLGYDLDHVTGMLSWREAERGGQLNGRVPNAILKSFKAETMREHMQREGVLPPEELPSEEAQFHEDVAATKILAMAGFSVAQSYEPGWQAEIIEHSFNEGTLLTSSDMGKTFKEPEPETLTVFDILGSQLREKLAKDRGEAWAADHRIVERNRSERRRAEAASRKKR